MMAISEDWTHYNNQTSMGTEFRPVVCPDFPITDLPGKGVIMKAFVLIKIRAGDVNDVVSQLREIPSVSEAHMTFGPYDAVVVIDSPDLSSIGTLISSSIQPIKGVEQTLTCLAADL